MSKFKPSIFKKTLKKLNKGGNVKTTKSMRAKAMKKAWK